MKLSVVQEKIVSKVRKAENNITDFLDVFAFELIEDEIKESDKVDHYDITLEDILMATRYLNSKKLLEPDEIYAVVTYVCSNMTSKYNDDLGFVCALAELTESIRGTISSLNRKIKMINTREDTEELLEKITYKKAMAIQRQQDYQNRKNYFKVSLRTLTKIRKNLTAKYRKQKIQKKEIIPSDKYDKLKDLLIELANAIDKNELTFEELVEISAQITKLKIDDVALRHEVRYVISKLKPRVNTLNRGIKKTKKQIKNLTEQECVFKSYLSVDPGNRLEYVKAKDSLKVSYKLLKDLMDNKAFSDKNVRIALKKVANKQVADSKENSYESLINKDECNNFYDENFDGIVLNEKNLSTKNDTQEVLLYSETHLNTLKKYGEGINEEEVKKAFILNNRIKNTPVGDVRCPYCYSVEKDQDKTIIRLHVLNIYPYLSDLMSTFLFNEAYKKLAKMDSLSKEDYQNFEKHYDFKKDIIRPTISYTFAYDQYKNLADFKIEQMDVKVVDSSDEDFKTLVDVYRNNRTTNDLNMQLYFEKTLKEQFMKYITENEIPMLLYGKAIDEYEGDYKKTLKKCAVKMGEDLEVVSDALEDLDTKTFNKISYSWYKNYLKPHYSISYDEDFEYPFREMALLKPFSFQGYNVQKLLNCLVLNDIKDNPKVKCQIRKEQENYVNIFNGLCKYIDNKTYINMICSECSNEKAKAK